MNVARVDIYELNVAMKYPIRVPIGVLSAAENVAVRITTDSGLFGWGEASPFAPITGDCQESNIEMAREIAQLIKGKDALAVEARMQEIGSLAAGQPSIRSAFDMAFYDVLGKAAGLPIYKLLGGSKREIRTDWTIGLQDTVEETLAHAERTIEQGFRAVKLKVGRPGLADVEHVRAVRELIGPDVKLRIDSNQGWDLPTAVANIRAMDGLDVEYSEQPLIASDNDNLARLRQRVDMPICADESVFDHRDALKLVKTDAVDYFNIKLGKSGGIGIALKIDSIAEAASRQCMVGCFAESRLGLSAAAQLAMARPNIVFVDLDSAYGFKADPVVGGMTYDDSIGGLINLPDTPGHGAEFSAKSLAGQVIHSI